MNFNNKLSAEPPCAAVDIGASSGRVVAGSGGELRELYRFESGIENGVWDVARLEREVRAGLELARGEVSSLAIDTWAVDYALMRGDELLSPCYAYRSDRTAEAVERVHAIIPQAELYERTGIQFQPFNTIYQLYADKLAGRLENATDFLMIPSYLSFRLCGEKSHEFTNASTTGLLSLKTGDWDYDIIDRLGLPRRFFGKISRAGELLGEYCGIKVALCASHDTASAVEACESRVDEEIFLSSGTWSLLGAKLSRPIVTEQSRESNWTNEGGLGYVRYLKNIDGLYPIQQLQKKLGITFSEMVELARSGETAAGREIDGIYRSLARQYASAVSELERNAGREFSAIHIVGGGSKNAYLNELTAEYTGKKIIVGEPEATAIGNLKTQTPKTL